MTDKKYREKARIISMFKKYVFMPIKSEDLTDYERYRTRLQFMGLFETWDMIR